MSRKTYKLNDWDMAALDVAVRRLIEFGGLETSSGKSLLDKIERAGVIRLTFKSG